MAAVADKHVASHSRWLKCSPTQVHKTQEHKRQVTSYDLLIFEICVLFLTCALLITFVAPSAWLAPQGSINVLKSQPGIRDFIAPIGSLGLIGQAQPISAQSFFSANHIY